MPPQTGVYRHEPAQTDPLFITLSKKGKDYSATIRNLDQAISEHLLHRESQAKGTVANG